MASPFARFRKRQKMYMAMLGVMCMIAFVFGGITCSNQPQSADNVVASTKYGDVHESQLAFMRSNLDLVNRFLESLVFRSAEKTMKSANLPPQFFNQVVGMELQRLDNEGFRTDGSETAALDLMILARKAGELGVVVSDQAINDFINQRSNKQLTRDEIAGIIYDVRSTPHQVFEALRQQLLSVRVQSMFGRGLSAAPPAQQWEYYQRLNRRARAEIVPVAVSDFVSEVPDPAEETLRKYFEEHKNVIARAGSPEQGFKQPHKVALQYLKADYDKLYNEAQISDEQIEAQYEKAKDTSYLYTDPPLESSKDDSASKSTPEEKDKSPESKDPGCDESCESENQEPAKPTESKPEDKGPALTPGIPEAPKADQQPAETPAQPTTTEPAPPESEKGPSLLELSSQYGLPRDIRGGPKPKHAPLWSVKDRIRRELAGQQARKEVEQTLDKIKPILDRYYNDFALWKSEHPAAAKDDPTRPKRPDFVALAKEHGLTAHETGLVSLYYIVTETDVGQAIAERGGRSNLVAQALESPPVFKEGTTQDAAGNHYLFWKTQDVPEHVPDLDDPQTRREVLAAWKQEQARDKAEKHAETLAAKAVEANKPLAEVFAEEKNIKVTQTIPFTWMTQGSEFLGPQEPRITTIPGVNMPGADFMRRVFSLEVDKVGVAFNAPKTDVYVMRVTSLEPSPRVLMEKFLAETPRLQQQTYFAIARDENVKISRDWIKETRETAGLHWKREAYPSTMR